MIIPDCMTEYVSIINETLNAIGITGVRINISPSCILREADWDTTEGLFLIL